MAHDHAQYIRQYVARIREIVREGHQDCRQPSCCLEGLRNYRAQYMRDVRTHARETVKPGHQDCRKASCCRDGYRNRMRGWTRGIRTESKVMRTEIAHH